MDEETLELKNEVEGRFNLLLKSLEDCGPSMFCLTLEDADITRLLFLLLSNNQ
jgi:hypothetical protein